MRRELTNNLSDRVFETSVAAQKYSAYTGIDLTPGLEDDKVYADSFEHVGQGQAGDTAADNQDLARIIGSFHVVCFTVLVAPVLICSSCAETVMKCNDCC